MAPAVSILDSRAGDIGLAMSHSTAWARVASMEAIRWLSGLIASAWSWLAGTSVSARYGVADGAELGRRALVDAPQDDPAPDSAPGQQGAVGGQRRGARDRTVGDGRRHHLVSFGSSGRSRS